MPSFEKPSQGPQEASSEAPERPSRPEAERVEEARRAIGALNGFLDRWRREVALGVAAATAIGVADLLERRAGDQGGDTKIADKELLALDPEASPERVRAIIDTLPEGFVDGEVVSIGFIDETYEIHESYGPALREVGAAGTAGGGTRAERTVITFWKGMKNHDSEQIWNGTFLHEAAHANDWDNDAQMELAERMALKAKIGIRVLSEDRYRSSYVEAISNPDPVQELEIKAKEYWAEIVEAHLKGEALPAADEAIVREFLVAQDPDFDRDAELLKRRHVLDAMAYEESVKEVVAETDDDIADGLAWVEERASKPGLEELDAATQRQGRRELVEALRRHAAEDKRLYVEALMEYFHAREDLLAARTEPRYGSHGHFAPRRYAKAASKLARAREIQTAGAQEAMEEIQRIVDSNDLVIGRYRGAKMDLGEKDELFPGSMVSEENEWIYDLTNWELGSREYDVLGPDMILQEFEWDEDDEDAGFIDDSERETP